MNQYKVCFWLNVPSSHQTLFLEALHQDERIDLKVRYFDKPSEDRLKMGWRDENSLYQYEQYVSKIENALKTLTDWKERIHIIMGYSYPFNKELVPIFIENKVDWVHWSERFGIRLAARLHYNVKLFEFLRPYFLWTKKAYGKLVNEYALGCFAQGKLARRDFIDMGIDNDKVEDLYYTTEALGKSENIPEILQRFPYKYTFLYTGRLNHRKGIEDLLVAFSSLHNADKWGLVLLGNDETNGYFKEAARDLDIENKILFAGSVKADEISNFFSFADVFVLPSRYDGWGAVINEAASVGLPIIASDQTGAALHLIDENKNGFIFPAGHKKKLTEAMQRYISDTNLLLAHGNYSKEIFKEFTPDKNVERFYTALKKWKMR